jgi:hypothetical protein
MCKVIKDFHLTPYSPSPFHGEGFTLKGTEGERFYRTFLTFKLKGQTEYEKMDSLNFFLNLLSPYDG